MTDLLPSLEERWYLRVKDSDGNVVAQISNWINLEFTRRVNAPGEFALTMGPDDRLSEFEQEGQVEMYRRVPLLDLDWYKEAEYTIENIHEEQEKSVQYTTISGVGYNGLLDRRIPNSYAGSSESSKSDVAETVMKEIVDEQLGPSAGAGRVFPGLSIAADQARGNSVDRSFAHKKVLGVLQGLTESGGVDFAIGGTGAGTYEFEVYPGQLGTDRCDEVLFSLKRGNMAEVVYEHKLTGTANAIRVGGKEQGADRAFHWEVAAGVDGQTRREAFVPATNEEDAELPDRGEAELEEHRDREVVDFRVLQTLGSAYGKHYELGDLVSAQPRDTVIDMKVMIVQFRIGRKERYIQPILRTYNAS